MNGKPVISSPVKSVINFTSGFKEKLLSDGPTFSLGTACAYSCAFCYVPAVMARAVSLPFGLRHEEVVIRRENALEVLKSQLVGPKSGKRLHDKPDDKRVIFSSPLVDVAANIELCRETAAACAIILHNTNWQIRLLSKSNLLPYIAKQLIGMARLAEWDFDETSVHTRMIFGVSTGTLDDKLAQSFEQGTPLVSKRIESLHWLQDYGFRTYGMVCPNLPQRNYDEFASEMRDALRYPYCEHVWAEVLNARGESMKRTIAALEAGGFQWEADELRLIAKDPGAHEIYARATFLAHAKWVPVGKLRWLQYATKDTLPWWSQRVEQGAILL